ncbi:MAG: hypothetical protein ACRDXD_07100 [Acidimicrobiia bacterium]
MSRVVVVRSPLRMWLLALLGVPFLVFGTDLLFGGRLLQWLGRLVYQGEPDPFELRDRIWAGLFLVMGAFLSGWGIKELVWPSRLALAEPGRLCLALGGPFRGLSCLAWTDVTDLQAAEGTVRLIVKDPSALPESPWGARWVDQATLEIAAGQWYPPAGVAVERMLRLRAGREVKAEP